MNKLNNKGMTLLELLVALSLLMIISIGIYTLITKVALDLNQKDSTKEIVDYSNIINSKIHTDLIRNKPFAIFYKNSNTDQPVCKGKCTINNYIIQIQNNDNTETFNINDKCLNVYPCAVYAYEKDNKINTQTIILNIDNKDLEYGIKYDNAFEVMPNQKDIRFLQTNKPYIEIDKNNYFIINFPFYIIGDDTNYGFKIAYPFLKEI